MIWRLIFLGLWLPVTIGLAADGISLVRVGEIWSYRTGTNAPSNPITDWRSAGFDDSSWTTGASGFSTLASTDFYEATILPQPVSYRSLFIRHKFAVADPSTIQWLILRLNYDDGFVAYLNGAEIARRGLTNDPVAFDDYSDPHVFHQGGAAEDIDVSASKALLHSGDNVLAIEVHTAITNEVGNTNGMRLVPELLANFDRGPFIQNATTNSIQVIWRTPVPADSAVDFGTNQTLGSEISDAALTTNHVVTLTNLQPGSQYFYCVRSTAGAATAISATNSFRTLKMSGDVTFLVLGDTGTGLQFPSAGQYQVASAMQQVQADLVLQLGDAIDIPYFTFGLEDTRFLSVFRQQMQSVPFFLTMGNHEVDNGALGAAYLATFHLPTNSVTGTSHYYSFDHGDAHFVAVYMPFFISIPEMESYRLYEGSTQYNWLTNDLASSSKPWKIIYLHHPLATSGSHRTDVNNGSQLTDCEVLRNMLLPVAKKYGVELIFSGHDHHYERFIPIDGVQLIDNGAGGSFMDNIRDGLDAASSQFYGVPGFLKGTIQGDELFLQAITTNGNVFDFMTLRRSVPSPQLYESAWHTPLVETIPANDGHGNINGQTFDFVGNPIRTLTGQFSNLGRVYVNNDFTNLFIGFEQAMFYSNNNVFLFIETPGRESMGLIFWKIFRSRISCLQWGACSATNLRMESLGVSQGRE
jgi:Calcineurin-like phosphoesterase/Purple acid Phosphatase, N-terminal domain